MAGVAYCEEFEGRVVKVHDGDTLWIQHGEKVDKCRLKWIDCPEVDQPGNDAAQRYVWNTVAAKTVVVKADKTRSYDRLVVEVLVDGQSLNAGLVRWGLAHVDQRYTKSKVLLALEASAKDERRGVWKDENVIPPWEWRKKH